MKYITHFYTTEGLPSSEEVRKITYLTTIDEEGEIFLGTDNNPLDKELVEKMIREGKLVQFIKKVALPENQTLFINKDGYLTLADRLDATKNSSLVGVYDPVLKKLFQE